MADALQALARQGRMQPVLPELLAVGDRFDALERMDKDRLRRLIVRHRALSE